MKHLIVLSVAYLAFLFYVIGLSDIETIVYLMFPYIIIFILPVLVIHVNYFINSNSRIWYSIEVDSIVAIYGQEKTIYDNTEIESIFIFATPNRLKDSATSSFPFEDYHYVNIKCKSGQIIILTSLHSYNLDKHIQKHFEAAIIRKIPRLFPLIAK
ncbi:hypothetical protein [Flavobacterium sp. FPG59]|uniref:hypothetical protein n=1 Tax=Flavobacterium sp. FPG59 TaxID=1929267 RepID=UPI0011213BBB|nr:hypothetical protein [Flavobacterium sp. FPG59]